MTATVRYYTRSGNTKKVADAIAKAVGCEDKEIPAPVEEPVDILFLGASVYWGGIASEVKDYIQSLDKSMIGKVVVFSTSALAACFPANGSLSQRSRHSRCKGKLLLPGTVYGTAQGPPQSGGSGERHGIWTENDETRIIIK